MDFIRLNNLLLVNANLIYNFGITIQAAVSNYGSTNVRSHGRTGTCLFHRELTSKSVVWRAWCGERTQATRARKRNQIQRCNNFPDRRQCRNNYTIGWSRHFFSRILRENLVARKRTFPAFSVSRAARDRLITGVELINRRCHERAIYAVHVDQPSPLMSVTGRLMANK